MKSIWEYLFPAFIMALFCAFMASKRNKNPLLWFVFGLVGNFIAIVAIGGFTPIDKRTKDTEAIPFKLTGSLIAASICLILWGSISGISSFTQLFNPANDLKDFISVLVSLAIDSIFIILGINLLKVENWALKWSLWFTVVMTFLSLIGAIISEKVLLGSFYVTLGLAVIILLLFNRKTVLSEEHQISA